WRAIRVRIVGSAKRTLPLRTTEGALVFGSAERALLFGRSEGMRFPRPETTVLGPAKRTVLGSAERWAVLSTPVMHAEGSRPSRRRSPVRVGRSGRSRGPHAGLGRAVPSGRPLVREALVVRLVGVRPLALVGLA